MYAVETGKENKKMKKKLLILALCVLMIFTVTACAKGENTAFENTITFCLDWTPNTNHTGLYVALEKGYYREAGLTVDIVQPAESTAALMVAGGQAQFGVEAQDTMAAALIGDGALDITAVAAILQHNTSGIMSLAGSGITSPKSLENKRYSTWDSPIELAMLRYLVEKDGGDFNKVTLIPNTIEDEPGALKEKQTDAVWVFYGWSGIYAKAQNVPVDFFDFISLNEAFDYYTPVIISSNAYLTAHPDQAKAFLSATKKGYEYAAEHPEEAAAILIQYAPELDGQDFVLESQRWISDQYKAENDQWGVIDAERWNAFYQWLNDNGLTEEPLSENAGFTMDYLE